MSDKGVVSVTYPSYYYLAPIPVTVKAVPANVPRVPRFEVRLDSSGHLTLSSLTRHIELVSELLTGLITLLAGPVRLKLESKYDLS